MFDQLSSSASVLEGGSAEFSCTVLSTNPSPTRLNSVWAILMPGPGGTEQLLGINNINMIGNDLGWRVQEKRSGDGNQKDVEEEICVTVNNSL